MGDGWEFLSPCRSLIHVGLLFFSSHVINKMPLIAGLVMAALCNRAGHYIFARWFLSFFLLSCFFPRLISAVADWMSTILLHMVWP